MSRRTQTIAPDYFDALYAKDEDPWNFAASEYERRKYQHTLASLPKAHFSSGLEVGCSIGILTRELASRCERLLAIDAASEPLAHARRKCAGCGNVEFARKFVPGDWPAGNFDLILLSEVVYYLDAQDVAKLAARIKNTLSPGGALVLVHWTGETDYPLTGDEAAQLLIASLDGLVQAVSLDRRPEYRLDVLVRREVG
jgi:2-polyprenyl-3-methyl-5-hydroxy-6-metoxy-1,4-benzoquinol methylase